MWIVDITSSLQLEINNYYVFNPSIIAIPRIKDSYLVAYRICHYKVAGTYHPWKIWDNGYKYFSNPQKIMDLKYRNKLGGKITIDLTKSGALSALDEHDSTALALFTFDGFKFTLQYNVVNPFGEERNQDARLCKVGDSLVIVYNCFEKYAGKIKGTMRCRALHLSGTMLYMGREEYMFSHMYKPVEKNCVFTARGDVIYGAGPALEFIRDDKLISRPSIYSKYLSQYKSHEFIFSSSTPPIHWTQGRSVACGHLKILYKKIKLSPFSELNNHIDMERIRRHG